MNEATAVAPSPGSIGAPIEGPIGPIEGSIGPIGSPIGSAIGSALGSAIGPGPSLPTTTTAQGISPGAPGLAPDGGQAAPRGELMTPEGYVLSSVVLAAIGVFGFVCNGVVLLIYAKDKQLWTPLNLLLLNLVIGDFSVATLGTPFTFVASLARRWIFGDDMCTVYGFFMALMGITSIATLTVLSFERYMMISRPFGVGGLSKRGAAGLVAAAWLYSIALTAPPLFGWGEYTNEAANISCSVNWETRANNSTSYIVFLFVFGLLVPVIVIIWSYLNIICTIRYNTIRIGQVTRAQQRIGLMVGLMVFAFLFAWTPYAVLALYAAFGTPDRIEPAVAVAPALFAKSSICYNPLIYVMLNTQFRASWKRLWAPHSSDTSLEAGAEPSMPDDQGCTQQTSAGYASPVHPMRAVGGVRPNTPPPLFRRQRKLERLQQLQRQELRANNNNNNNRTPRLGFQSAPNSEAAPIVVEQVRPRSAPNSTAAQDSSDQDEQDEQRVYKRVVKREKLQHRQRLRQLKEVARKQSRQERQLEKELQRHERELDQQREKQERLEDKRRRKEDSLRRLQQQQFSAKFHPACLVALVTDPRSNSLLSVKVGEGVNRHSAPGLLARCFGKQQGDAAHDAKQDARKKKSLGQAGADPCLDGAANGLDAISVSSADCNHGIEVFEVEIRRGDQDHLEDHRLPPTESAL